MRDRRWDSLHPDTLYGDAAARVLCRVIRAEPSGRTLQQCLDAVPVKHDPVEAERNGREGDGIMTFPSGLSVGVECKASTNGSANVCWSPSEMGYSQALILAAWVPGTDELCWFSSYAEAWAVRHFLQLQRTWLICRDRMPW